MEPAPVIERLNRREDARVASLTRIAVGGVLLTEAACRWPFAVELYSTAGSPMPLFPTTAWAPPDLPPGAAVALHSALVFALAGAVLGWQTRLSLGTAATLGVWFGLLDGAGTFKKWSVVALHLLVLLGFTRAGAAWSFDARFAPSPNRDSPAWPRFLMRAFVASVYLSAGLTKLRLPDFATGELLEFALLDDVWGGRPLGQWLAGSPRLLSLASLGVLLFELLFPFLVWVAPLRRPMLAAAAAFHLSIEATMYVGPFSWVMLAALTAFLTEDDLRTLRLIGSPARLATGEPTGGLATAASRSTGSIRSRAIALGGYVLAGSSAAAGGLAVQRGADIYGVFASAPPPLKEIASDEWLRMQAAPAPSAAHFVHRLEIGSRIAGFRAQGERAMFRRGMTVHAIARLIDRRPPMRLDWLLIAPDGREAARSTRRLDAARYATVAFELPANAPAGRFRVILQLDGYDAAEASFEIDDPAS